MTYDPFVVSVAGTIGAGILYLLWRIISPFLSKPTEEFDKFQRLKKREAELEFEEQARQLHRQGKQKELA